MSPKIVRNIKSNSKKSPEQAKVEGHGQKLKIGIAAIFKDEGPYILEWIAAHQVVGIDKFYIANNNSTDGSNELLDELHKLGIVTHIDFPGTAGEPPQLAAYNKIMQTHGHEVDWMAFIDADEFLIPENGGTSIRASLEKLSANESIGAIAVNWAIYGSSGQVKQTTDLVTKRFTQRAETLFDQNLHYKSIIRCSAFASTHGTPHFFNIKDGFNYVHTDGSAIEHNIKRGPGLSEKICWAHFKLHHYVIKSRQEFEVKKKPKGSATTIGRVKGDGYFTNHDKNDVGEPIAPGLLDLITTTTDELKKLISPDVLQRSMEISALAMPTAKHGHVDKFYVAGDSLHIVGWSFLLGETPNCALQAQTGEWVIPLTNVSKIERPDVQRKVSGAGSTCGFRAEIDLTDFPKEVKVGPDVQISCASKDFIENLSIDPTAIWPDEELRAKIASAIRIPNMPAMPATCIEYLSSELDNCDTYLEYGSGGSTVLASRKNVKNIISIESDENWLKEVNKKVTKQENSSQAYHPLWVDLGPTREWGYPTNEQSWKNYWKYSTTAWTFAKSLQSTPDLVLIDGRFRVACFLACLLYAKPGCRIMFDDYADRPFYHSVETFLKPVNAIERMAVFVVPEERPCLIELVPAFTAAITDVR